jgi:hypothetical protein
MMAASSCDLWRHHPGGYFEMRTHHYSTFYILPLTSTFYSHIGIFTLLRGSLPQELHTTGGLKCGQNDHANTTSTQSRQK